MTAPPYRLSAELAGHNADVRSIDSIKNVVFSSSRDGTARSWIGDSNWKNGVEYSNQHQGFVNAVSYLNKIDVDSPAGFLLTGGQDKLIQVWPLNNFTTESTPSHTLIGHDSNVCALHTSADGSRIVSGSWDKTAIVWDAGTFTPKFTLKGHEQAVWAVLALDDHEDLTLTGAADNLVKLWKGSKAIQTFKGHTQAVRALARLAPSVGDGNLFASAGNDATIRLWNLAGEAVTVLNGHDSFVYSLSAIPDSAGGGLISGGEDRTVRIWRAADGECQQTIVIPAVSVWTVKCLENGDIATGSSDGLVRIFSKAEERIADTETLANYDQQVSATALNPSQVGDLKKDSLPGPEALVESGKKEGQVLMIKNAAGTVEAHQWSSASGSWTKIGEVVDAVGSNRKQLYNGQEYDHVFDVDFADGVAPLKLPFNVTENPYEAAQKFLYANELPQTYIDEVVKFIEKNTEGTTLGIGATEFVDPYTGASRYTGGGAGSTPAPQTGGFSGDPYTGGGKSTATSSLASLLPYRTFLTFTQQNLAALSTKLDQINAHLLAATELASLALSSQDDISLKKLITSLSTPTTKFKITEADNAVILKLLAWPSEQRFPSLDLVRVLSLYTVLPESLPTLLEVIHSTSGPTKEQETNSMLAFRALANIFNTHTGKALMKEEAVEIIDVIVRRGTAGISKPGKLAMATVVLNYSILATTGDLDPSTGPNVLDLLIELLRDTDGEVVYRSLISLGNLLLSPKITAIVPAAGLERYKTLAREAVKRLPEQRNKLVLVEILRK